MKLQMFPGRRISPGSKLTWLSVIGTALSGVITLVIIKLLNANSVLASVSYGFIILTGCLAFAIGVVVAFIDSSMRSRQ